MKKWVILIALLMVTGGVALAEVLNYDVPSLPVLAPQAEEDPAFAHNLIARLGTGRHVTIDGVSASTDMLRGMYGAQDVQPLWTDVSGNLNRRAQEALQVIRAADEQGLAPQRYPLAQIDARLKNPDRLALELLMTQAFYHYVEDMLGGVNPMRRIPQEMKETWPHRDPLSAARKALACWPLTPCLAALAPSDPRYATLRQKLSDYRALEVMGGWPKFPVGEKMDPGKADPRVPVLRQILVQMGDGPQQLLQLSTDTYDPETVEAVKAFQRRHGLNPDGVIGKQGQAALAVPVEKRIESIRASLAEWRKLPHDLGKKYLLVNIPAFQLQGFENGREAVGMRIVVGQADQENKWHTPLFSNVVKWVIFNPNWTVPKSIATEELLTKIQEDPAFLATGNYKLIKRDEETGEKTEVDPATVAWTEVTPETFDYTIRQDPGEWNALGKVKFELPDNQNVYLHDTASRKFFMKDYRALSHGCIRVAQPMALTYFLMDGNKGWDKARIDRTYVSNEQRYIPITPIPAHSVYMTAWIDGNGTLRFADDIYKLNGELLK